MSLFATSILSRLLALALFALCAGVASAQAVKPSDAKAAAAAAAKERMKNGRMSVSEVRKLYEEISKQRDVMIADFEALAKQMKDATEEQKKQLKEKMEEQKKAFEEATNALQKQIREEQRRQRQNAAPSKR